MNEDRALRVLVIEDSRTLRGHFVESLEAKGFEVVGEASDGESGIALCERLRPDVISLDIVLPGISGLEVTAEIMHRCPTPILIVSASRNRGEVFRTLDALSAGAVDVLDKPKGTDADDDWVERYRRALRLVAGVRVIRRSARFIRPSQAPRPADRIEALPPAGPVEPGAGLRLIAIGASTGGPAVLAEMLPRLPARLGLPLLLVIHLDRAFEEAFRDWLATLAPFPVRLVSHGDLLPTDTVLLIAPAGRHLTLRGGRLLLDDRPERHSCRPSIDVLFESLAEECPRSTLAILLTGMGVDGARGLLSLRQAGARTVAQDEASSAVFGMPRAAIELGAAERVLGQDALAPLIAAAAAGLERPHAAGGVQGAEH
ncbi:chemotaxis protein CheB [Pseudomarimonas salicorniae]|uniref:Protein-glutamate methylesterase/protein-glutamine glutaminase n=1 Tax=Pseudomarimonas salicorniae TaxID=2933270 RepID=A0ABT0GFN8_9GAMM|nr:chemotaxis protein CheB [Lysobacter sp. CAU 1642]MCK7593359.1 response regulator [Lysobacter sp. CAU 1642]